MSIDRDIRIAIIGGGLAGFAVAIVLKKTGFTDVTVYERDTSLSQRRQGYGLTLLQGISALKMLGQECLDRVTDLDTPSRSHYIFDNSGNIINFFGTIFWQQEASVMQNLSVSGKKKKKHNLHISRTNLRNILYDECLKVGSNVRWEYKATAMREINESTSTKVDFANGESIEADLIIGADGINSQARKFKYQPCDDYALNYLGMIMVLGITYSEHPLTQARVFQTMDGCTRLFAMPYANENHEHNFMWQLSFPLDELEAKRLAGNVQELKAEILKRCGDWHEPVPSIIKSTEFANIMGIPAYDREAKLPVRKHIENIVLLGDAAHPMSPFKGQGANQALLDAVSLGHLVAKKGTIKEAIEAYENEMLNRVRSKVEMSRERVKSFHDPDILNSDSFEYRGSNQELLAKLVEKGINSRTGEEIESLIVKEMKELGMI